MKRKRLVPTSWRTALDIVATVAMVIAAVAMISSYSGRPSRSKPVAIPTQPLSLDGAALKGNKDAPVAILAFTDFQCPFCREFATGVMGSLDAEFISRGSLLFALRHLPLKMHPYARQAATLAVCAGKQDRFWQIHDRLFSIPSLDAQIIQAVSVEAAPDQGALDACIAGPGRVLVENDLAEAERLGISGTPTFFVGTLQAKGLVVKSVLKGAKSFADFQTAIEANMSPR